MARRDWALRAGAAAVGLVLGWVATGPAGSMGINWDAAAYAAEIASGRRGWSAEPWSSHFGLGSIYLMGAAVARGLGGSVLDGFRALGAIALAGAAALVAEAARRLSGSRALGFLLTLLWVAAWGVIRLVATWEDNVLFLPVAAGAILLALARIEAWRTRDSLLAGLLVGAGSLVSWQAAVYLFPPLYACACLGGPGRSFRRRAAEAGILVLAFLGARVGWALLFFASSDGLSFRAVFGPLFARPEPSYFPRGWQGWAELARAWRTVLRHVATGLSQVLGPWGRAGTPRGDTLLLVGAGVLTAALAGAVVSFRRASRRGSWRGHLVIATAAALLLSAALYVDLPVDKYKRYDFVPLLAVLALAAALGTGLEGQPARAAPAPDPRPARRSRWASRWTASRSPALVLVGGLLAAQLTLALVAHARFRTQLAAARPPGYHGRGGETWFAFARRLRDRTPAACGYLFAFFEVQHARYQLEIPAALWSELPGASVLGAPPEVETWRRPLPPRPLEAAPASIPPCAWISPEAQALLARPLP